jgi:hypothetical protein
MKCDSQASLLAHTFTSPCFGHEPKARVATLGNGADLRPKEKKLEKRKKGGSLSFFFAKTWPYALEITKTMKKGE